MNGTRSAIVNRLSITTPRLRAELHSICHFPDRRNGRIHKRGNVIDLGQIKDEARSAEAIDAIDLQCIT